MPEQDENDRARLKSLHDDLPGRGWTVQNAEVHSASANPELSLATAEANAGLLPGEHDINIRDDEQATLLTETTMKEPSNGYNG